MTQNGDLANQAVGFYQDVVDLVPYTWPIRNHIARTYLTLGKPDAALPYLQDSLAITKDSPKSAEAFFLRGQAYLEQQNLTESVKALERSLELDPSASTARPAHGMLAEIYNRLGNQELADKHRKLSQTLSRG